MKVAVVGAGASGLAAIRVCLEYGIQPVCFEKTQQIGGLWRYKPEECQGEASVMKSTIINTSKEMSAYSDFPPPKNFANFMHNTQMVKYFELYAQRFRLLQYIKFKNEVLSVCRSDDYKKTGKYTIAYTDSDGSHSAIVDGVLCCTGHHVEPHVPDLKNQDVFKGRVLHSHSYKHYKGYEDTRVAIVGIGNSGGDVAVELSRVCSQVYLLTRRGSWVTNRIYERGYPTDLSVGTRFRAAVFGALPRLTSWWVERELMQRFDHAHYGLKPAHAVFAAHLTVNDDLPNRIASGTMQVRANVREFTRDGLLLDDGSAIERLDAVILATGYSFGLPCLEHGRLIPVRDNRVDLYQHMYPPTLEHATLAVVGLVQPLGSIMPISEMQCRLFCDVLTSGRTRLPSPADMQADVELKRAALARQFVASRRHTIQVNYAQYMDELATLLGAKPRLWRTLLADPRLGLALVFGPMAPYQFRLCGPHAWPGARDALLGIDERTVGATQTRRVPSDAAAVVAPDALSLVVVVVALLALIFSYLICI